MQKELALPGRCSLAGESCGSRPDFGRTRFPQPVHGSAPCRLGRVIQLPRGVPETEAWLAHIHRAGLSNLASWSINGSRDDLHLQARSRSPPPPLAPDRQPCRQGPQELEAPPRPDLGSPWGPCGGFWAVAVLVPLVLLVACLVVAVACSCVSLRLFLLLLLPLPAPVIFSRPLDAKPAKR